jgi:hypothetical protein
MTVYQKLTSRIEFLLAAELACINADAKDMAAVWRRHRDTLEQRRRFMPISFASSEHDPRNTVGFLVGGGLA